MDKALWGKRVTDKLHACEKNIDETINSMMALVSEIQAGQADLKVSAVATDPSLSKLVEALTQLQQARTSTVASHRRLEKLADGLGIRTVGVGISKPPQATDEELVAADQRAAI